MMQKRTGAECIALRYGRDYRDVMEMRCQADRSTVAVYTMFDSYVCCPPAGAEPPNGWRWKAHGEAYGRTVYIAESESPECGHQD
ncbi:hypothetical protein [Dolichospermum phage Dfl-JY45]